MLKDNIQLSVDCPDEVLTEICRMASVLTCDCPGYLTQLLRQVRAFRDYTTSCIEQFPEDAETHIWLNQQGEQVEKLLFQTILELMQKEALIDEFNQVSLSKLSARAQKNALKQVDGNWIQ